MHSAGDGDSGEVLLEDRATLPPDPRSASAARRLVRRLLEQARRGEWSDAAELAVSEVVSNAVLHAHTEVEVAVRVLPGAVRVDVFDHSPLLPTQRSYGEHATTGRGLGLLAMICAGFGVEPHEGDGKTVWFCVGEPEDAAEPDLDAWGDDAEPPGAGPAPRAAAAGRRAPEVEGGTTVVLRGLPVSLWLAAQQHHDALIREYVLARSTGEHMPGAASGGPGATADEAGPPEDRVLAADQAHGVLAAAVEHTLEQAREAGAATQRLPLGHPSPLPEVPPRLDVALSVGPDDAGAFAALQDTLDSAERLAARGLLLARPALTEVLAVRDWACEQVIAQVAGVDPSGWPGIDGDHLERPGPADALPVPDWDPEEVRRAERSVIAADESNRIVAVSEPLARLVGWQADDLVGRRVVVLVPPRLRELHVAGFTRHLTTGQTHVLGVPLELPVLRADGREVMCRFLVERAPDTGARAVYLAWIDAIDAPGPGAADTPHS